ncbi:SIMPL domain-containing protein [Thalassotalea maritima]|uniref:SIMPL domain-containing protein n=1 Tax=Thalassotalea maritima TaxID=3242416 RepID=UPI003528FD74
MRGLYLFALVSIFMSLSVAANDDQKQGVEVVGKGALLIEPDIFTFSVTLADRANDAKQSKQVVDEKSQRLIDKAVAIGIDKSAIETARMYVQPIYPNKPREDVPSQPTMIEVSRVISFTLDDFKHYDQLLNEAITLGVRYISPLQYETRKADSYYRQALELAVKDASIKAKLLAKQLNVTLKEVTYITEVPMHAPRVLMRSDAMVSEAKSFSSNPGKREIAAQVVVNFSIE